MQIRDSGVRYKELFEDTYSGEGGASSIPFEIDPYIVEIDTGVIDADYMNSRFIKYLKTLDQEDITAEQKQAVLDELHKSFASLSQEEQKYANVFLNDIRSGNIQLQVGKSFRDYITEYVYNAKNKQVLKLVEIFDLNIDKLEVLMKSYTTEANINEYGRFDALIETVDRVKAKAYFEKIEGTSLTDFKVSMKIDRLLKEFLLNDGVDL